MEKNIISVIFSIPELENTPSMVTIGYDDSTTDRFHLKPLTYKSWGWNFEDENLDLKELINDFNKINCTEGYGNLVRISKLAFSAFDLGVKRNIKK